MGMEAKVAIVHVITQMSERYGVMIECDAVEDMYAVVVVRTCEQSVCRIRVSPHRKQDAEHFDRFKISSDLGGRQDRSPSASIGGPNPNLHARREFLA
mmetsp:Transcript_31998/g.97649  ORF Transcript_31998/g.97649 Transcript_31998/m.97649 type:complete len:98 (-) Transcript_31998:73-366(-)|eukprot:scaffold135329_cov28-Tisochrysis_lutea.AAC.2